MRTKRIVLIVSILAVCGIGAFILNQSIVGRGTYDIDDSINRGVDIAGVAEWDEYIGHRAGHGTEHLYDDHQNYWWCSQDYNCSVTATFSEPIELNEIHIHTCHIEEKMYIPRTFEIWINNTEGWELLKEEKNNTVLTSYKLPLEVPKTVSGVEVRKLYGNSFYGIGDYDFPCIEEIEIYKVRATEMAAGALDTGGKIETDTAIPDAPKDYMDMLVGISIFLGGLLVGGLVIWIAHRYRK
tara:strand:- start:1191 stop:1910 length:720 start_codon:yes stop_codon:yes gene_type:complete